MNLILQNIGIILLWILFMNFLFWWRYQDYYRRKHGEKYFNYGGIVRHIIATFIGLVFGIATVIAV